MRMMAKASVMEEMRALLRTGTDLSPVVLRFVFCPRDLSPSLHFVPGLSPSLHFVPGLSPKGTKAGKAARRLGSGGFLRYAYRKRGSGEGPLESRKDGHRGQKDCFVPVLACPYLAFIITTPLNNRPKRGQNGKFVPKPLYIVLQGTSFLSPFCPLSSCFVPEPLYIVLQGTSFLSPFCPLDVRTSSLNFLGHAG